LFAGFAVLCGVYATPILLQVLSAVFAGAHSTSWSFIQSGYNDQGDATNCKNSGKSCKVTLSKAVTKGNVLVIQQMTTQASGSPTLSSITEESGAVDCTICRALGGAGGINQDTMYVTSATGGESTITCNFTAASSGFQSCSVVEFACAGGCTVTFDTGGSARNTCIPACGGVSPTALRGVNDVIVQTMFDRGDNVTSVAAPYTPYCIGASGAGSCAGTGAAYLLNTVNAASRSAWNTDNTSGIPAVSINVIALSARALNPIPTGWSYVQSGYALTDNMGFYQSTGAGGACDIAGADCTALMPQAVTPGNLLLIVSLSVDNSVRSLSSVSGDAAITKCAHCLNVTPLTYIDLDAGYLLSATGGETSLTCTLSGVSIGWMGCIVYEFHWSGSSVTYDTSNYLESSCTAAVCAGVGLTLGTTTNTELVYQTNYPYYTVPNSISSPYKWVPTTDAYLPNATSSQGTAPNWTLLMTDSAVTRMAIAFIGH
jgi:hypothetical protein